MTQFGKDKETIIIGQEDFEGFAKNKISNSLPIESHEVYMVWFNYTMGFMKGLFSFSTKKAYPMSHDNAKLPDYVEVTFNRDKNEIYFDWYTKERQEVINLQLF